MADYGDFNIDKDEEILQEFLFEQNMKNIVKEKVKLYTGYRSPAGTPQPDWKAGDFQLGRVTVFTGVKDNPSDLYERTKIGDEGEGTWFIGVTDSHIKVWIGGSVDTTLEIERI